MAFQISPGVNYSEIDLTAGVPAVSTTVGAAVIEARWGPLEERILVSTEDELVNRFYKPDNNVANRWFTAANFLAYSNALWVVRAASTGANSTYNASSNATGVLIKNDDHYEANYDDGSLAVGDWVAKYPGALGNSLKVSTCPSSNAYQSTLTGALSVTANATTVTGVATSFDTQLVVGDLLQLNAIESKVASVTNSTSLVLSTAHSTGAVSNTGVVRNWEYYNKVNVAPGTSPYTSNLGGTGDEIHVVVVDEDGEFTGVPNTVLEVYEKVSLASDAKTENGSTNYYKNTINSKSAYIRWADHNANNGNAGTGALAKTFGGQGIPQTKSLSGGRRGAAPSNADFITGYALFKDAADVDVSFLLGGDANQTIALDMINNIAESRKDCLACVSPLRANVVNNSGSEAVDIKTYRNTLPSSSYAVMDSGWKYQYDKYNDVYRYVPLNGDTAGLMARTDQDRDAWWSPAGFQRGQIKSVVKLAYNPKLAERDVLYKAGVNPVVSFSGEGTVLYGDKTLLSRQSAFDRINVRRLFITLEKAISTAAKQLLFEFNDDFTRNQFRNLVEPFLRDIQGRRGITDFRVVADTSNNTAEVIDRNEFIGDIYIKPARSINFIQLNFVAVRTGVEFNEVVGKF
jgi:hypothetical protein